MLDHHDLLPVVCLTEEAIEKAILCQPSPFRIRLLGEAKEYLALWGCVIVVETPGLTYVRGARLAQ